MLSHPNNTQAIDVELASSFRTLRFQPALEVAYQKDSGPARKKNIIIAGLIATVFYDLFLFTDWQMIPDVFEIAIIGRLFVFTPIALITISAAKSLETMERLSCVTAVLAVIVILVLFNLSESPHRQTYHYGSIIIMIFTTVVQRVRFRYCVLTIVAILAVQGAGLLMATAIDAKAVQADVFFYVTIAILVLFAGYGLERESRRGYLLATRSRLMNDQLNRAANVDPLTGLWNRRYLNAIVAAAWKEAERTPRDMAMILLDIDHFKIFNDTYGHLGGDECLRRIGACLRRGLEAYGDVAIRFGGEEFLIFVPDIDATAARVLAVSLRQAIHEEAMPFEAKGHDAIVTASIGIATGRAPLVSASALMSEADAALYEAKGAGRDCIRQIEHALKQEPPVQYDGPSDLGATLVPS